MYWAATAVIIALAILKREWTGLNLANFIYSVFLLPGRGALFSVGWRLQHEMLFYLVFAIAIFSRAGSIVAGLVWLGLVVARLFGVKGGPLLDFVNSPYHVEFALGIFAAVAAKKWQTPQAWLVAFLGLIIFSVTAFCGQACPT